MNVRWGDQADAALSVLQAVQAIETGAARVVALVYGTDQRSAGTKYGGPQAMGGDQFLSYVYHAPWGMTSQGAFYALMFRVYADRYGISERDLGYVAVAQRQRFGAQSQRDPAQGDHARRLHGGPRYIVGAPATVRLLPDQRRRRVALIVAEAEPREEACRSGRSGSRPPGATT